MARFAMNVEAVGLPRHRAGVRGMVGPEQGQRQPRGCVDMWRPEQESNL